jgi:hypothetical protein
MDEANSEQLQSPPQVIEKPTGIMVLGVLGVVQGCYRFFSASLSSYKMITAAQQHTDITTAIVNIVILSAISLGFLIWLFIVAIGLLKMKKWARREAIIYAWVQIGLFVTAGIYTSLVVLLNLVNPPSHRWLFGIANMRMVLFALIYPVLLLIFMKTEKVKRAFAAIGG